MEKQDLKKMDLERARSFISKVKWQFAKTFKDTHPHSYTIKTWLDPRMMVEFEWMILAINRNGDYDYFYQYQKPYWEIDGQKYWMNLQSCFTGVDNSFKHIIVINRKPADQPRTDI